MIHINDIIDELQKYADLEGSELGEACQHLINLWNMESYISCDLAEMLEKEIRWHLVSFKTSFEIKEETREYTVKYLEFQEEP